MKNFNGSLIWAGAMGGLLLGWSSIALALWLCRAIVQIFGSPINSLFLLLLVGLLLFLPALPIIGFAVGMTCTFFWQSIITKEQLEAWRLRVLVVLFLPLLWLGFLNGIAAICLTAPITVKQFNRGIEVGMNWWPKRRWRHLFGLANDWEREENGQ